MLFKVGDILKLKREVVESSYCGCKGTTVYDDMIEKANKFTYEVIACNNQNYTLKRNDGETADFEISLAEEACYKI